MIGAGFTAENASIPLHAFLYVNDADAVAASTLNPVDCHAYAVIPFLW
jgi:hypothetical protein